MPGKVNNGFNSMLNDIMKNMFLGFCVHTSFFPGLYKIRSFAMLIPEPRSPLYEQLQ